MRRLSTAVDITVSKAKGHEEKEFEAEIIYYLRLYNELKGREGAAKVLTSIEEEINNLVEILKEF